MKHASLVVIAALALGACAGNPANEGSRSPADPFESVNRPVYRFNNGIDAVLLKPLAKGYELVVPQFARTGVGNFQQNLRTPLTAINNLLQGKGREAASDSARFLMNSTVGLLGLLDPATDAGLAQHNEDFGQTVATWGVPAGPYLTMPLLGPNTVRDALMTPFNIAANPLTWYRNTSARDKIALLRLIDTRQRLFAAEALIKDSPDRYVSLRESFLQRRNFLVHDGDPPIDDDFYEDFDDDFEDDFDNDRTEDDEP